MRSFWVAALVVAACSSHSSDGPDASRADAAPPDDAAVDATVAVCGNGMLEPGEQCDDGNGIDVDLCTNACTPAACGDGVVSVVLGEACDDGNAVETDGCLSTCQLPSCGDGFVQAGEQCDDGNLADNDGCDADCVPSIADLVAGYDSTCIRTRHGAVKCWGAGGSLGTGNMFQIGDDEVPATIGLVDVGGPVAQLAAGAFHVCGLLESGAVRCWGPGSEGDLGYGNTAWIGDNEAPAVAGDVDVGGTVLEVAAGASQTCARLAGNHVRCWGYGQYGQLGYPGALTIGDDETPASVGDIDIGADVVAVAVGDYNACAVVTSGGVRCWGSGGLGENGYGNTSNIGDNETPATAGDVPLFGDLAAEVVEGQGFTCMLTPTGAVRCWGANYGGQLGYGNTTPIGDDEVAGTVGYVDVGGTVVELAAGVEHTCALLTTGAVRCWGGNLFGELGYGNTDNIGDDETPASAGDVPVGGTVVHITAGGTHTCALLATGAVRCWGWSEQGGLGYGNINVIGDDETPASAGDVQVF